MKSVLMNKHFLCLDQVHDWCDESNPPLFPLYLFCFLLFHFVFKKGKKFKSFWKLFWMAFLPQKKFMSWFDEQQSDSLLVAAKRLQGLQGKSVLVILFFQGGVNVEDQNRLCYSPSSPRFESRQSMFSDWISDNNAFNCWVCSHVQLW